MISFIWGGGINSYQKKAHKIFIKPPTCWFGEFFGLCKITEPPSARSSFRCPEYGFHQYGGCGVAEMCLAFIPDQQELDMYRQLPVFVFCGALAACGTTTSPYVKVGKDFGEAIEAANTSVKLLGDQRLKVGRVAYANNLLVRGEAFAQTVEKAFVNFVCSGAGALATERGTLKVLGKYGKSVHDLMEKPDQDVASLWASMSSIDEKMNALKRPKIAPEASECADEVDGLLSFDFPTVPETGFLAALTTLKAVVAGLNDAAVAIFARVDDAARVAALRKYIESNKKIVEDLVADLDRPDTQLRILCNGPSQASRPYCKVYRDKPDGSEADFKLPLPNKFDAQFLWQKWASLRQPFLRFAAVAPATISAKTPEGKAKAMDELMRIHRLLAEFDALRGTPSPHGVAAGIRESQNALVDVASGKVPPGTGWGVVKAWTDALGGVADGLGKAKDAVKDSE